MNVSGIAEWAILRGAEADYVIPARHVGLGSTSVRLTGHGVDLTFVPSEPPVLEMTELGDLGQVWPQKPESARSIVLVGGRAA